ncbi:MAG: thermonuclease family protein [Proteobacteria bacterium]|nr:thermonuclease family protein [Pseudomonadota bacterium]
MKIAAILRVLYIIYGKFGGMRMILAACLLFVSLEAHAGTLEGRATVHDGDTIRIGETSIRIWGIDAVELKQTCEKDGAVMPCGMMAREALAAIIGTNTVTCTAKGKSYKRVVGTCFVNGRDIAAEMTRLGMAYDAPKYSKAFYNGDQTAAQTAGVGLWAMNAQDPAHWRACNLRPKNKRPADCTS